MTIIMLKVPKDHWPTPAVSGDSSGWKFWLSKLGGFNGNFIEAEMVKASISSDEYRKRFGQ